MQWSEKATKLNENHQKSKFNENLWIQKTSGEITTNSHSNVNIVKLYSQPNKMFAQVFSESLRK